MTGLIAEIDFSAAGNGHLYVADGWAEVEATHRWTLGRESRVRLPVGRPGPDCVLAIDVTPCRHPPELLGQAVVLAVNGVTLATVEIAARQVMAYRLPPSLADASQLVLSFTHTSCHLPRGPGQVRGGQPLGLMVHSVRVFRLREAGPETPRRLAHDSAPSLAVLAEQFESLGQGCEFGLVQRQCGTEPLGLLRFVDTMTALLADGLVRGFAGAGDAAQLDFVQTADAQPRYRWHHKGLGLLYDTRLRVDEHELNAVRRQQSRRLGFLQRKFCEDMRRADKIFVLTRVDPLTEPEALAVYCALRLHGPCTLLWTVFGDNAAAGQVDRLLPGLLRAQLGETDEHRYGSFDVWINVMAQAVLF